jgi:hypothetical protein
MTWTMNARPFAAADVGGRTSAAEKLAQGADGSPAQTQSLYGRKLAAWPS